MKKYKRHMLQGQQKSWASKDKWDNASVIKCVSVGVVQLLCVISLENLLAIFTK